MKKITCLFLLLLSIGLYSQDNIQQIEEPNEALIEIEEIQYIEASPDVPEEEIIFRNCFEFFHWAF